MSTTTEHAPIAIDAYVTPEDVINAILASGGFDGEKVQSHLGSRLATMAGIKILEKKLKEMGESLIPEANVEFVNLQRQLNQQQPRAFGVAFRENKGSTSYSYTEQVKSLERSLKDRKDYEKKEGLAEAVVKPPSNGSNFSIVV